MTIKEALNAGFWTQVKSIYSLDKHPSHVGFITKITPHGVSVNFGASYDAWFWAEETNDGRKKDMRWLVVNE